jgi:hypothetical protein
MPSSASDVSRACIIGFVHEMLSFTNSRTMFISLRLRAAVNL